MFLESLVVGLPARAPQHTIQVPTLESSGADGKEGAMPPRSIRRSGWKKKDGRWTCSLGSRGMRVRLFQNRRDGPFYRAMWIPGVGRDVASLQTKGRLEAEDLGRKLLAAMLGGGSDSVREDEVVLGDLWKRLSHNTIVPVDGDDDQCDGAVRGS